MAVPVIAWSNLTGPYCSHCLPEFLLNRHAYVQKLLIGVGNCAASLISAPCRIVHPDLTDDPVPETDRWLIDYGENHCSVDYAGLYWLAVPLLVIGTVGLLWSLPVPEAFFNISPFLNWGTAFLMAAAVYYFIISVSLAIGMLPFMVGVAALASWLEVSQYSLIWVSAGLCSGAVIGLWLGQYAAGGVRAVLQDIQLMMIAPVWLLSVLYRRLGIPF